MQQLLLLAALFASPRPTVLEDRVDLVEVNHFYDEKGEHVFDQLIFYEWSACDSHHHIRAWRLLKTPAAFPLLDRHRGGYVSTFHDREHVRQVRAASFRETWTQHDPELVERDILPREQRRELSRPWRLPCPD